MRRYTLPSLGLVATSALVLSLGASSLAHAESAGQYMSDAAITAKVKAALIKDSQLKASKVSVETTQGIVQLSGSVDTKGQEDEAVSAASRIEGVKTVKDLLAVKATDQE